MERFMVKKVDLDRVMFEGLGEEELKNTIVRNVEQMKHLQADLKAYRTGINEALADLDARNDAALEELSRLRGEVK